MTVNQGKAIFTPRLAEIGGASNRPQALFHLSGAALSLGARGLNLKL